MLMLAGIDDRKLNSTTSHPSSSSHCLPRLVVCHSGPPVPTIMPFMRGLVLRFQGTCFVHFYSWSEVGFGFGYGYVCEPSISAVVSVTVITGLQLRRDFRLRPKPKKLVPVSL